MIPPRTKRSRSEPPVPKHQLTSNGESRQLSLQQECDELKKRVAELRREKKFLLASLARLLRDSSAIDKQSILKGIRGEPSMAELIAELD